MIGDATYTVMFYGVSAVVVLFALVAVNARKLLRAALALMGMLAMSAGLYILLRAEFLAGVQVLVYVGGIVVFGSLMGAMFVGQQYLQNVLGYSTLEAGASIHVNDITMPEGVTALTHGQNLTLATSSLPRGAVAAEAEAAPEEKK